MTTFLNIVGVVELVLFVWFTARLVVSWMLAREDARERARHDQMVAALAARRDAEHRAMVARLHRDAESRLRMIQLRISNDRMDRILDGES